MILPNERSGLKSVSNMAKTVTVIEKNKYVSKQTKQKAFCLKSSINTSNYLDDKSCICLSKSKSILKKLVSKFIFIFFLVNVKIIETHDKHNQEG